MTGSCTSPRPHINCWALREVWFDENGDPGMHRSPEQEPVFWQWRANKDAEWTLHTCPVIATTPESEVRCLYAHPTPRPLTDERTWTLLLVGPENGLVGKRGEPFLGAPGHYERVNVRAITGDAA